ncbi:MAG: hypothetical protein DBX59_04985 [Bacillota bacterium]|nr:MAG: hypothetical protein DBX59_04985 [Bacillota bacterium]
MLHIYADYEKRLGAYKTTRVLSRDYGINISIGRVYRLMKSMDLPKMSTQKSQKVKYSDTFDCNSLLQQKFEQSAPNVVWVSDITYIIKLPFLYSYLLFFRS